MLFLGTEMLLIMFLLNKILAFNNPELLLGNTLLLKQEIIKISKTEIVFRKKKSFINFVLVK